MKQARFATLAVLALMVSSAFAVAIPAQPKFLASYGADAWQTELSQKEIAGLLFMREEEKLALDVYTKLAQKWGPNPFQNIANSEQTHTNAVKGLLEKYGITDPAANTALGVFVNKDLQKLYHDLVKAGSASRVEALRVGATIEDLDLKDLEEWMAVTTRPVLKQVYDSLARGSRNHMRAFVRGLKNAGVTYKPVYISQEAFDKILATPNETGGPRRRGGYL